MNARKKRFFLVGALLFATGMASTAARAGPKEIVQCVMAWFSGGKLIRGDEARSYKEKYGTFDLNTFIPELPTHWFDSERNPNPHFIALATEASPPLRTFMARENFLIRDLNRKIDKGVVTAMGNHFKTVYWDELQKEMKARSTSWDKFAGAYGDYKSFWEVTSGPPPRDWHAIIETVSNRAALRFESELTSESWYSRAVESKVLTGIQAQPSRMHVGVMAGSADEAALGIRFARSRVEKGNQKILFHYHELAAEIESAANKWVQRSREIAGHFPKEIQEGKPHLFEKVSGDDEARVLSFEAIELIRSFELDPRRKEKVRKNRDVTIRELMKSFENRFGKATFSDGGILHHQMEKILEMYEGIDPFNLNPWIAKREIIVLGRTEMSLVAVDFKGAGSLNAYETQRALIRAIQDKDSPVELSRRIAQESRAAIDRVTQHIDGLKSAFEDFLNQLTGVQVSNLKFTGDDGYAHLVSDLTESQIKELMHLASATGKSHFMRLTFLPKPAQRLASSLNSGSYHRLVVFGEEVEKKLRKDLEAGGVIAFADLKKLGFGVKLNLEGSDRGKVRVYFSTWDPGVQRQLNSYLTPISQSLQKVIRTLNKDKAMRFELETLQSL